ncbi:MAG: capsid cement protein [Pseudomonadota bacterium]
MRNYVQPGRTVTVPAPAALASGEGVQIGELFGVAATAAESGAAVALTAEGVFELPKEATTDAYAIGDAVEWDAANRRVAALDSGAKIGVCIAAAGATAPTVRVRLSG